MHQQARATEQDPRGARFRYGDRGAAAVTQVGKRAQMAGVDGVGVRDNVLDTGQLRVWRGHLGLLGRTCADPREIARPLHRPPFIGMGDGQEMPHLS